MNNKWTNGIDLYKTLGAADKDHVETYKEQHSCLWTNLKEINSRIAVIIKYFTACIDRGNLFNAYFQMLANFDRISLPPPQTHRDYHMLLLC